ncbi:DUF6193 family natural product biosynthesis protein [Streptomyces sp. R44]|uniref:DUF6193 family natural product biosynthesis protein n=1 Tax=Streptomyces sp. R44 TaxID=3238633 RepID=A0AB39TCP5_9ACTN
MNPRRRSHTALAAAGPTAPRPPVRGAARSLSRSDSGSSSPRAATDNGRIEVPKPEIPEIPEIVDPATEAFALVVSSLPEGCGPAVLGDANEVRRRQDG